MKTLKILAGFVASLVLAFNVMATPVDTYEFKSTDNQKRALSLAHELRCPQCQNQNLIDSNSPVAQDLRLEVYTMVDEGKSDAEIVDFMTSRYGDFVLYKPRLDPKTYILWLGPFVLMLIALYVALVVVRKQRGKSTAAPEMSEAEREELEALLKSKPSEGEKS
ncbi:MULTISPECIES: heme lyase NrfEFG subunit NrfF [Shewanella]|uniref:Formate-dependent nitrite reductase complex subunit n=1 Tax=Shewanella japonica TaxID=93973 RepID=A0ABN4YL73_9GAMM|nr:MULTISPECIES: heme lyase NrfEFG subunit NrfF [Shewanella]ARD24191.1 cytochrome c biogenesis protein CcmL [Shewanella japonica]KPZ67285.1 Cytochrome c-type biogenesis protein CcmH precursor [Shewanella sp. P1-14-1]